MDRLVLPFFLPSTTRYGLETMNSLVNTYIYLSHQSLGPVKVTNDQEKSMGY